MILVFSVVVLSGFKYFEKWFELDNYVIIALLGSATAGLFSSLGPFIKGSFMDIWK